MFTLKHKTLTFLSLPWRENHFTVVIDLFELSTLNKDPMEVAKYCV